MGNLKAPALQVCDMVALTLDYCPACFRRIACQEDQLYQNGECGWMIKAWILYIYTVMHLTYCVKRGLGFNWPVLHTQRFGAIGFLDSFPCTPAFILPPKSKMKPDYPKDGNTCFNIYWAVYNLLNLKIIVLLPFILRWDKLKRKMISVLWIPVDQFLV